MTEVVVLTCPVCGLKRALPAPEASTDRLVEALGAHVLDAHPDEPPGEIEPRLERALKRPERKEISDDVEPGGWREDV